MDGKELLKHLMREAGENPNSIANKLKKRSLQSQIQRFIDGATKEPRVSTLQPVADFFQIPVQALFVEEIAHEIAFDRDFLTEHEKAFDTQEQQAMLAPLKAYMVKRDWDATDLARALNKSVNYCQQLLGGNLRLSHDLIEQYMVELSPTAKSPTAVYTVNQLKVGNGLADLIVQLGIELEKIDVRARKPVSEAIKEVLASPEQAKYYASMVNSILSTKQTNAA
jgi:transcriptional regulator with XRE-family HTH domain